MCNRMLTLIWRSKNAKIEAKSVVARKYKEAIVVES
jgi:hypothetical protein